MVDDQNRDKNLNEKNGTTDDGIICPNCKEKNPIKNLFCNFCGHSFVDKVACPNCLKENPTYNNFCSYCGATMRITQTEIIKPEHPSRSIPERPTTDYYRSSSYVQAVPLAALPHEERKKIYEIEQNRKKEARNLVGMVFGIIFLVIGLLIGLNFILTLTMYSSDIYQELLNSTGITDFSAGLEYGSITAMNIPPMIILIVSGLSLILYKPKNDAWKGLYVVLRHIFIIFSGLLAIIALISFIGWFFYNPTELLVSEGLYWFFGLEIGIPINMNKNTLYLLLIGAYLLCIVLMLIPAIIRFIQNKRREKPSDNKSETDNLDNNNSELVMKKENSFLAFYTRSDEIEEVEIRKGKLRHVFYLLKNNSLTKSMELLGLSVLTSIIVVFILSPFVKTPTEMEEQDPINMILSLAWAGIFEELSFRLMIIGSLMIIVVLTRYLLQQYGKTDEKLNRRLISSINDETMVGEGDKQKDKKQLPKLTAFDVIFAFRGKNKIIRYPEWILIGISSILFGFAHWSGWGGSWDAWKIIQAGISGIFLSYAFVKYGIESAIFIHITNNLLSGLTAYAVELENTEWLVGLTAFATLALLILGIMKLTSLIINMVYKYYIVKQKPPYEMIAK
ncbi:MAG: CPBP family intramembrane metalloprotease [Asgard group archaeon]|nr:CPBP family intramembrane metalloprotease [Asgard group archaeon]